MKHLLGVLGLVTGFLAYGATEASAVVCARGVVRAGCVGPYGAVGVRRPVFAPALSSHPDVWFRPGWWSAADGVDPRLRGSGATKPPDTPQRST